MDHFGVVKIQINNKLGVLKPLKSFFKGTNEFIFIYVNNNVLIFSSIKNKSSELLRRQSVYIPEASVTPSVDMPHKKGVFKILGMTMNAIDWQTKMIHTLEFSRNVLTHTILEQDVKVTKKYNLEFSLFEWDENYPPNTRIVCTPQIPQITILAGVIRNLVTDIKTKDPETLLCVLYDPPAKCMRFFTEDKSFSVSAQCMCSDKEYYSTQMLGYATVESFPENIPQIKPRSIDKQQLGVYFTKEGLYIKICYIHEPFWFVVYFIKFIKYEILKGI